MYCVCFDHESTSRWEACNLSNSGRLRETAQVSLCHWHSRKSYVQTSQTGEPKVLNRNNIYRNLCCLKPSPWLSPWICPKMDWSYSTLFNTFQHCLFAHSGNLGITQIAMQKLHQLITPGQVISKLSDYEKATRIKWVRQSVDLPQIKLALYI